MPALIDLTGNRYGRLTVLKRAGSDGHSYATWLCRCECGRHTVVRGYDLRTGHTRSCGCLQLERIVAFNLDRADATSLPLKATY